MNRLWKRLKKWLVSKLSDEDQKATKVIDKEPKKVSKAPMSKTPGITCPECTYHFPVSIPMLLSGQGIECPNCGLKLNVDTEASKPSLDALKEVQVAMDKAEAAKKPNSQ